jgi:hypothetical protein
VLGPRPRPPHQRSRWRFYAEVSPSPHVLHVVKSSPGLSRRAAPAKKGGLGGVGLGSRGSPVGAMSPDHAASGPLVRAATPGRSFTTHRFFFPPLFLSLLLFCLKAHACPPPPPPCPRSQQRQGAEWLAPVSRRGGALMRVPWRCRVPAAGCRMATRGVMAFVVVLRGRRAGAGDAVTGWAGGRMRERRAAISRMARVGEEGPFTGGGGRRAGGRGDADTSRRWNGDDGAEESVCRDLFFTPRESMLGLPARSAQYHTCLVKILEKKRKARSALKNYGSPPQRATHVRHPWIRTTKDIPPPVAAHANFIRDTNLSAMQKKDLKLPTRHVCVVTAFFLYLAARSMPIRLSTRHTSAPPPRRSVFGDIFVVVSAGSIRFETPTPPRRDNSRGIPPSP